MSGDGPVQGGSGGASAVEQIQEQAATLFAGCLKAFHAFGELAELSENMRVLSLNAELAAGRAGEKGSAVRVLTQYTRELVNHLAAVEDQTRTLRSRTYAYSAAVLRVLHLLRITDRTLGLLGRRTQEKGSSDRSMKAVRQSRQDRLSDVLHNVSGMVECVDSLSREALRVAQVSSQANSVATNIAIEAAIAGSHSAEFWQVANTMRHYVEQLKTMIEDAGNAVRQAITLGRALEQRTQDTISRQM